MMDSVEIYKLAVATRLLEIKMFWQRSNYFMVLNTAIAIAFFSLKKKSYAPVLAVMGGIVSFLWYLVCNGSKFWQSRWEQAAARLEQKCCPDAHLFAASPGQVLHEVEESLAWGHHHGLRKLIDKQVLRKPSVSYQMTLLALVFILFWLGAFAISFLVFA